jgi:hypothetical protein
LTSVLRRRQAASGSRSRAPSSAFPGLLADLAASEHMRAIASGFNSKASPIQLLCHSFDLAHSRYSRPPAPVDPGADR